MIKWPQNPQLGDRFCYVDPIGGASVVTWEWMGVAGWRYVGRD